MSVWTQDMDAALLRLASEGLSASQIAARLSTPDRPVSRNAVIGRAHRLPEVELKGTNFKPKPEKKQKPAPPSKPKPLNTPLPRIAMTPRKEAVKPPSLAAQRTAQGPLKPVGVSLMDMKLHGQCRYVLGDPADMFFCGAATGTNKAGKDSPYCPHHHHLCHADPMKPARPLRRGMAGA